MVQRPNPAACSSTGSRCLLICSNRHTYSVQNMLTFWKWNSRGSRTLPLSEPVYRRTLYFYHGKDGVERQFQRHVYQRLDDEYILSLLWQLHSVLHFRVGHSIRILLEEFGRATAVEVGNFYVYNIPRLRRYWFYYVIIDNNCRNIVGITSYTAMGWSGLFF